METGIWFANNMEKDRESLSRLSEFKLATNKTLGYDMLYHYITVAYVQIPILSRHFVSTSTLLSVCSIQILGVPNPRPIRD